jgi:hypothetical protein
LFKEWYDFDRKLARIDLQPQIESYLGMNPISEVHDFNQGIRYIFDQSTDKCINKTDLDPYATDTSLSNGTQYVRIKTSLEMFHFDSVDYQYHGKVHY